MSTLQLIMLSIMLISGVIMFGTLIIDTIKSKVNKRRYEKQSKLTKGLMYQVTEWSYEELPYMGLRDSWYQSNDNSKLN